MLVWIFAFLIFNLIVLAHEFGHYITAKKFGVKVNEFALGMGPKLFKIVRENTVYSMRCFPIGGFCELEGEENDSESENSFGKISVWKRMIVMAAGAFMNIVVGLIFSIICTVSRQGIPTTVVSGFSDSAVSVRTGLKVNDEIISINNFKTHTDQDVLFAAGTAYDGNLDVEIIRNEKRMIIKGVKLNLIQHNNRKVCEIDFSLFGVKKNFVNVINYSVMNIVSFVRLTWKSIVWLIKGKVSLRDMAGPIGIASQIGSITSKGLEKGFADAILGVVSFMVMFTISIGIFNLLPFPALDGGRILMLTPELISGKPLGKKIEYIINIVGFCLLILLMIFAAYNDILRIIKNAFYGPDEI
ncbi:MAG: M50 family metallopeptidase [Oscillospiraceae bacterium]|nr:M50 family metallopeptidase [Oscillospiraceae bacterium]